MNYSLIMGLVKVAVSRQKANPREMKCGLLAIQSILYRAFIGKNAVER